MNIIESVSRLNPPLCAITGCRYLSRPLKRRSQRIGKIRLWLNRIKRGKFTFGNSKSERVEGSSRVAPATLLCTCLHLPPLSLSIFHSLSAPLPWDRVSLCSASFCTVSFRSNGVQCGRRSLRDCLHTDRRVFRASRFVSKPVHRLWNEEGGYRRVAQVHFTRPCSLLLSCDSFSIVRKGSIDLSGQGLVFEWLSFLTLLKIIEIIRIEKRRRESNWE